MQNIEVELKYVSKPPLYQNDVCLNVSKCYAAILEWLLRKAIFSRVHATLYVTMSVRWSVGWSVAHLFFRLRLWSPAFALTSGALQREREEEEEEEEEEETKEHRRVKRISTCGNGKRSIHHG